MATTFLKNLINPEVMGAFLEQKMVDLIRFAPIARMGTELQGTPGNTLTIPFWKYIGSASEIAEGELSDVSLLESDSTQVTVIKAVKNVELTDEAVLSGLGDPVGQAEMQLAMSLAQFVDDAVIAAAKEGLPQLDIDVTDGYRWVADALVGFGEDLGEEMFLFISPKQFAEIRKNDDFVHIANGMVKLTGHIGSIYGVEVVLSNKVQDGEAFLLKRDCLAIELKRGLAVELDRNVLRKTSIISADRHFIAYVRDANRGFYIPAQSK